MRGPLHCHLQALLAAAWASGVFTQAHLAEAIGKKQPTIGEYLRDTPRAGTLDLDEASAALESIGVSLHAFIVVTRPPVMTITQSGHPTFYVTEAELAALVRWMGYVAA